VIEVSRVCCTVDDGNEYCNDFLRGNPLLIYTVLNSFPRVDSLLVLYRFER
jgi:hypothetical protein